MERCDGHPVKGCSVYGAVLDQVIIETGCGGEQVEGSGQVVAAELVEQSGGYLGDDVVESGVGETYRPQRSRRFALSASAWSSS